MAIIKDIGLENSEEMCKLGKALSSPVRIDILKLLYRDEMIIGEIAKKLDIPQSSAAFHLKMLESAGLIKIREEPGSRGTMKVCSRVMDYSTLCFQRRDMKINETYSIEMPVGFYSDCAVAPTCGLSSPQGVIGVEDKEYSFYLPEKIDAGILWTSAGYVEYQFPNAIPEGRSPIDLSVSMEICSEAPQFRENWKSDLTLWINGVDCGTWTSPGDFGGRKGRLNPSNWPIANTQYGLLMTWKITNQGSFINDNRISDTVIRELMIMDQKYITIKIGNKEDARYVGGFNIFGKTFGDFQQDIILTLVY